MTLLLSNRNPLKLQGVESQNKVWSRLLSEASVLRIATAYITTDAILELCKIIEYNQTPNIELFIGMHFFDLFTKAQYNAVKALNDTARERNRGRVYLSPKTRFHGKLYSFCNMLSGWPPTARLCLCTTSTASRRLIPAIF